MGRVELDEQTIRVDRLEVLLGAELGVGEAELGQHGVLGVREPALDEAEVLGRGDPVLVIELLEALLVVLLRRDRVLDSARTALATTRGDEAESEAENDEQRGETHTNRVVLAHL